MSVFLSYCCITDIFMVQDFIKNAELMWKSSVWPASITARLACTHLKVQITDNRVAATKAANKTAF